MKHAKLGAILANANPPSGVEELDNTHFAIEVVRGEIQSVDVRKKRSGSVLY